MTIDEAYKKAIARKKEAVKKAATEKKENLAAEKRNVSRQAQQTLLQAYAQKLRTDKERGQALRSKGVSGGAAKLEAENDGLQYTEKRNATRREAAAKEMAIDEKRAAAETEEMESLAKLDAQGFEKQASSVKNAQQKALSMMRMGIYDASFASILGISDAQVRSYIKRKHS